MLVHLNQLGAWAVCSTSGAWVPLAGLSRGGRGGVVVSHLFMVNQGPLLSDVLLGQVDGWKDRAQTAPEASPLRPPVLGVCPWLAHPSSLTIV